MNANTKIHQNARDSQRMTFFVHFQVARQLKANAKAENLSIPDYLAFLVQRGLTVKVRATK